MTIYSGKLNAPIGVGAHNTAPSAGINVDVTGTYPYWRVQVLNNNGDTVYTCIAELAFFTKESPNDPIVPDIYDDLGTTYGAPYVGYPIGSSVVSTSYPFYEAFDRTTTADGWCSSEGPVGAWLGFHFTEEPQEVVGVKLVNYGAYGDDSLVTEFALEFSDDGIDWTRKEVFAVQPDNVTRYGEEIFWTEDVHYLFSSLPLPTVDAAMEQSNNSLGEATLPAYSASVSLEHENDITLPAITGSGDVLTGSITTIHQLTTHLPSYSGEGWVSQSILCNADITLPSHSCDAVVQTGSGGTVPLYEVAAEGVNGILLTGIATLPSVSAEAAGDSHNIGTSAPQLPVYELAATATGEDIATANLSLPRVILSAEGYSGRVSSTEVVLPAYTALADGHSEYVGDVAITLPMLELEATTLQLDQSTGGAYALNLSRRGLTQFDTYNLNSFARFNGVTLAAGPNGIVAISGETDNGAAIDASFKIHMNTGLVQRLRSAVVNYRSNGEMVLVAIPEEEDTGYEYELIGRSSKLSSERVKLGRGISTSNIQFLLRNSGGASFEIDSVDIVTNQTKRKVR